MLDVAAKPGLLRWPCAALCILTSLGCNTASPSGFDASFFADVPIDDAGLTDSSTDRDAAPMPFDGGVASPTVGSLTEALADAECGFIARCRELESAAQDGDCLVAKASTWRARVEGHADFEGAIEAARACTTGLQNAACWDLPRDYGQACWSVQSRGRRLGDTCADARDCAHGFCLSAAPGLVCGQCTAWRQLDETCDTAPEHACGPDAVCEGGRCLPLPAIGAGCAGRCQGLLDCPFDFEGIICLPPLVAGELCEPPFGNGRSCPTERALACVANRCEAAILVAFGDVCGAQRWCRTPEQTCTNGRCEMSPTKSLGEACQDHSQCEITAYCLDALCAQRKAAGIMCAADDECEGPLACLGRPATCQPSVNLNCR